MPYTPRAARLPTYVTLDEEEAIDVWRARQAHPLSWAEAIRLLLARAFAADRAAHP